MKKSICILLSLFWLSLACAVPASAADSDAPRYRQAFEERLKDGCGSSEWYEELYYHERNGATDWALVHGKGSWNVCWCVYSVLGDRILTSGEGDLPFTFDYGVYDVQQEQFIPIEEAYASGHYPDLPAVMEALRIGRLRGDMDADGKLTIKDATELQRCLAELRDYPADNTFSGMQLSAPGQPYSTVIFSDTDGNGATEIGDVTELQRILASQ